MIEERYELALDRIRLMQTEDKMCIRDRSGVKTGLPDILDRIADRTCSISDRCRISA